MLFGTHGHWKTGDGGKRKRKGRKKKVEGTFQLEGKDHEKRKRRM